MLLLLIACATCDQDSGVPRVEDTSVVVDSFDVTTTTYTCEDTDAHAPTMEGYSTYAAAVFLERADGWESAPALSTDPAVGINGGAFCVGNQQACTVLNMAGFCDNLEHHDATDVRLILHRIR